MNIFTPCKPSMPGPKAEMRDEEGEALDISMHIIKPELVVECGTLRGGSACIFARHADVVTFDPAPCVPEGAFDGKPIRQIIGSAPQDLPLLDELVHGRRWIFFHDSVHKADFLIKEIAWAFSRKALCAIWHDVALDDMLDAIPTLCANGDIAFRMMDFGRERTTWNDGPPDIWQGLGFCWNVTI